MSFPGFGRNTAYGPDTGPPPPRAPYGAGPNFGPMYPQQAAAYYPAYQQPQQPYWQTYSQPPVMAGQAISGPAGYFGNTVHPNKYDSVGRYPAGVPVIEPKIPSINMTNSTGGVGCEPGYHYMFHFSHTKIHVLLTGEDPPWNLTANFAMDFYAVHVPTNTTIGDLMKGFGAVNPKAELNKIFEVHEGEGGKWYKGMSFKGDDDKAMSKTIKELGWDDTRNGQPDGKPPVWLYVVKG
ncbi:hypothetical protein KVR01_012089 [Diaporthe batatas]|uniref:uncharacterized protein n=1 Tax=Diaporthe batatas TaxID=748121 RepID=UPI001D059ACA|nr:uncharacterized protein KVR01_012089 [Diaporthe batatas]KAG8158328.1 hypothetical protein KVR01_012089 [Diaporthe batatas]